MDSEIRLIKHRECLIVNIAANRIRNYWIESSRYSRSKNNSRLCACTQEKIAFYFLSRLQILGSEKKWKVPKLNLTIVKLIMVFITNIQRDFLARSKLLLEFKSVRIKGSACPIIKKCILSNRVYKLYTYIQEFSN